jgi:enoyl-CoA hydratase/carnithine racemase
VSAKTYPTSGDVTVAISDNVATVTLNRPERRNAVKVAMWHRLHELYQAFATDDDVRAVILTGAGEHFCAGADIIEFATTRSSSAAGHAYDRIVDECSDAIMHLPKPTIAAIKGFCIGGGSGLALANDFRFAAPSAVFAITAARLSIVYGIRETQNLLVAVGLSNAKKILYSAERFDPTEAFRIGFIDRIVEDSVAAAHSFAADLAKNAPLTISGAKMILNGLALGTGVLDLDKTHEMAERSLQSEDYREGQRAFAEKRAPVFKGR